MSNEVELETIVGNCEAFYEHHMEGVVWAIIESDSALNTPYTGLYLLKDGDHVTIYSPDDPKRLVWSGFIKTIRTGDGSRLKQHKVRRVKWKKWFFGRFPMKVVVAESEDDTW